MVTFDYTKTPITQVADYVIMYAAKNGASDIHFDPRENGLMIRIRIDGELQDYSFVPEEYEKNLITRLKLLANMNITETRLPQDGSIKGTFGSLYLDMRVACLPTNEGEKIAIRILDYSRSLEGLESLGFSEINYKKLLRMISVPNGILLVTGATGSGKSTTTYSILQVMNKKETNIITVEDPVEMNIEGLNQVQVNSEIGLTFANVLRSILRQDPNVILIGEIRDSETAKIAVRASITGHFVLSTIHTNDSLSTIERLLDMNVERYLLSSALTGIISQRLTKTLCPHCKFKRETTKYEKKVFSKVLGKDVDEIYDAKKDGCKECHNGYKGRIAIQEVLEIDDDIRNALNDEKLTKEERKELIYKSDVITLLQDALYKVLDGVTSFEEVYRMIEIDDEITDGYNYMDDLKEVNKKKEEQSKKEKQEEVKDDVKSEVKDKVKSIANSNDDDKDNDKENKDDDKDKTASNIGEKPSSIIKDNKLVDVPKVDVDINTKDKDNKNDDDKTKNKDDDFKLYIDQLKEASKNNKRDTSKNNEEKKDDKNELLDKKDENKVDNKPTSFASLFNKPEEKKDDKNESLDKKDENKVDNKPTSFTSLFNKPEDKKDDKNELLDKKDENKVDNKPTSFTSLFNKPEEKKDDKKELLDKKDENKVDNKPTSFTSLFNEPEEKKDNTNILLSSLNKHEDKKDDKNGLLDKKDENKVDNKTTSFTSLFNKPEEKKDNTNTLLSSLNKHEDKKDDKNGLLDKKDENKVDNKPTSFTSLSNKPEEKKEDSKLNNKPVATTAPTSSIDSKPITGTAVNNTPLGTAKPTATTAVNNTPLGAAKPAVNNVPLGTKPTTVVQQPGVTKPVNATPLGGINKPLTDKKENL